MSDLPSTAACGSDPGGQAAAPPDGVSRGQATGLEGQLASARECLGRGDTAAAAALYRRLIAEGVADVRVFCNLGAIAARDGRAVEAIAWLERGLQLDPAHARSHLNLGMALHAAGRSREARLALERAVALDPELSDAWNNLGVALASEGAAEAAVAAYRRALVLSPDHQDALHNLARLLLELGQVAAAADLVSDTPRQPPTAARLLLEGEILRLQGSLAEALACFGAALEQDPADADLRLRVGQALMLAGQADQALEVLLPLTAMRPEDAQVFHAVGLALQQLDHPGQAISLYEQSLRLNPDQVPVFGLLAYCHVCLGQHGEAIAALRRGLQLAPEDAALRCHLAFSLQSQGELEASIAELDRLLERQPALEDALNIQVFNCSIGSERLAARGLALAGRYWSAIRTRQAASARAAGPPAPRPGPPPPTDASSPPDHDGRLRIGFLSAEIGNHVVGAFLRSFLLHRDRDRVAVELFAVSRRFDGLASELAALADGHRLLSGVATPEARALLRSRRLDILVDTSGFTKDSGLELLAERCAAVQCHYIGFHASTGLDTIDWFIGDQETVPEAFAAQFSERLWRLPRPWLAREPDPAQPPTRAAMASSQPVLGCFNQLAKVRAETLDHWAAALLAVPSASLLIKDRAAADPQACERIRRGLAERGVEPERLRFLAYVPSWQEHMALYNQIDVALDTTPWSSATTGFDALAMGVPLVAIRGGCTAARMSAAILRGLGRPEWIASSPEAYGAVVAALCSDLGALRAGRSRLQAEVLASPLFDGPDLARALQEAFLAMAAVRPRP